MAIYLIPVDKGRRIVLDKAVVFIGRHPECDVVLTRSRKVSRKHCCIAQVNSRFMIRDLGSMNGTRLNGKRIKRESRVRLGDKVSIGDVQYVLAVDENSIVKSQPMPDDLERETPHKNVDRDYDRPLKPAIPLDLSQDYPVAIDDEERSIVVERSHIAVPAGEDPYMTYDSDDDGIPVSDSDQLNLD
ncbi:MAG: FHA domain-containing protein [Planctomycetota bacterium]|nr:FHA domain-containing protein [Planctomycetota bacterium]